jgi:hypothetical protein
MSAKRQRENEGTTAVYVYIEYPEDDPRLDHTTYKAKFLFPEWKNVTLLDMTRVFPDRAFTSHGSTKLLTDIDMELNDGDALAAHSWREENEEQRLKFKQSIALRDQRALIEADNQIKRQRLRNKERKKRVTKTIAQIAEALTDLKSN